MMNVSVIESIAQEALFNRLKELKNIKQNEIIKQSPEINKLKIRLSETDNKISTLMTTLQTEIYNNRIYKSIYKKT